MKFCIKFFSVAITLLLLVMGSLRLHPYYCLAKKHGMMVENDPGSSNDTLRIAFIGDSWAAYHRAYDSHLDSLFTTQGQLAHVSSLGYVGAKSKTIYMQLYTTAKPLLEKCPDYCLISAGINDAVAKIGTDFYVHHYMLILQQLIDLGIKPVVLEMPEVNYCAIFDREPWTMKMRHVLSSLLTDAKMYSFAPYRISLKNAIWKNGLQNRVVYVSADLWNAGGYQDYRNLYQSDETHLNTKGYEVLDSCIASVIIRDIGNNQ